MTTEEVLQQCRVNGMTVKLPDIKLERKEYLEVSKQLELIGGKWKGGKIAGFVFNENPTDLLNQIAQGEKRNIKKEFQFFATPDSLAFEMAKKADLEEGQTILEPSAGQGALVKAVNKLLPNAFVDCYELMPLNQTFLQKIKTARLLGDDFLNADLVLYDRIIANPPFTKNQDIDHIYKMYQALKPGGKLVTIASPSWSIGNQKKQVQFREWLEEVGAEIESLPENTFKESGTSIKTLLIIIQKEAA